MAGLSEVVSDFLPYVFGEIIIRKVCLLIFL